MNIREYYHRNFRNDLAVMFSGMDARDIRYRFGNDWMRECSLLPKVSLEQRAPLLVCLYFTILADQAMHSHFFQFHRRFEALTMYPKFLVGFGHEAHLNPVLVFTVPIQRRLVSEPSIRELIPDGMRMFVEETKDVLCRHMQEITLERFFERIMADTDVVPGYVSGSDDAEPIGQLIGNALKRAVADATATS